MPASESRMPASSSTMKMLCMLDGDRCGRRFGHNRKLDDEARADGMIFFHADRAVMIFHNAAHDGQAESGATLLGGKIRQEKFLFEFASYAVSRVGDSDLDRVAAC